MTTTLPLFPLGTVLPPGGRLPLQVFEPRYVRLLADLAELLAHGGEPDFGVVLIRAGHEVGADRARDLHPVGTVARLTRAADLGDGRFLLLAIGRERFTLEDFRAEGEVAGAAVPYPTGSLAVLPEPAGADGGTLTSLASSVRAAATTYLDDAGDPERAEALPVDPLGLSHAVGEATGVDVGDRQRLLEAPDTAARLRLALRLLRREGQVLDRFGAVPGSTSMTFNPN